MPLPREENVAKPEEKELERKKAILSELEDALANRELELATLKADLLSFQHIYLEAVGQLIAELDEIEARVAEATARKYPTDNKTEETVKKARKRANESANSYQSYREEIGVSLPKRKFSPTENLKKLFREVAKRIHPDLASNERDRTIREELMKRANDAYRDEDEENLRSILAEYEAHPESIMGDSIGAELIRAIRNIELINQRMNAIVNEIDVVMKSELFLLKKNVEDAKIENRDLFNEMANHLHQKIQQAKIKLGKI